MPESSKHVNLPGNITIRATKEQISNPLPSGAVILNLGSGVYYTLNEVGAFLWGLLQEPRTIQNLHDAVMDEYEISSEQCSADISTFIQEMLNAQLIETMQKVH
jgi:hypothetical protein